MTDSEFESHKGLLPGDGGFGSREFYDDDEDDNQGDGNYGNDYSEDDKRDKIKKKKSRYGHVPEELDWRKYGTILIVKVKFFWRVSEGKRPRCKINKPK